MSPGEPHCPDAGEIIWLDFDPVIANEQGRRRPAVVVSRQIYNELTGRCVVCPITRRSRGWPFEVAVPAGHPIEGVISADQLRSLSWRERGSRFIGLVPPECLEDLKARIVALLDL